MKRVARFILRASDDDPEKGGLILGSCFKGQDHFKPSEVWEIQEIMGELVLKRVGDSHITERNGLIASWCMDIGAIMDMAGRYLLLTVQELRAVIEKEEREQRERGT